jgi:GT2 family glycosyltransferase
MYMEDLDLCFRFWEKGWKIWYEPSVTALHLKGAISGRNRTLRLNTAFHYGMYRFYRKFYARRRFIGVNVLVYSGIGTKLVFSAARSALNRRVLSAKPR